MTTSTKSPTALIVLCVVVAAMGIAFGYNEAAVVVYLRAIFHPAGFSFPLAPLGLTAESHRLLLTEVGREAATIVLIFSGCLLAGQNRPQRLAYFMIIFAMWDIFYYVWLKALLGWPASVMDWDVLFLIPVGWAGPVLAPVMVSAVMLVFAGLILYRDCLGKPIKTTVWDWLGFALAALVVIVSFCIADRYMSQADYAVHFSWPLFMAGLAGAVVLFVKCLCRKEPQQACGLNNQ